MKDKISLILAVSLAIAFLLSSVSGTGTYNGDGETSTVNAFGAWVSTLWTQTTQADFDAGVLDSVDTLLSPGDVRLAVKSDWYDTTWSCRASVTINNSGSDLTDYQTRVQIAYDSDMQADFNDIRFTASNGTNLLSYWRQSFTAGVSALFWVKVPSIPSGSSTIYIYYGNAAANSSSNGNATFDFFDDFTGNLSKWNIHTGTDVGINASYGNPAPCLEISGGSMDDYPYGLGIIGSDATYTGFQDGIIEADIYPDTEALPEIVFRGNYDENTGYKGRWDTRGDYETPWMTPPYDGWGPFGEDVLRFGIANQWQKAKLVITDSTFEIYSNDNLMSTVTDDMYSNPGEIGLANHYGGYSRFDNVRVRKYASPEPTTIIGLEEKIYISSGTIASLVLDTVLVGTKWDALSWDMTLQSGTGITFKVRASDISFTEDAVTPLWVSVGEAPPVISSLPAGRYKQWQATLTTSDTSKTPILHEVRVYYH